MVTVGKPGPQQVSMTPDQARLQCLGPLTEIVHAIATGKMTPASMDITRAKDENELVLRLHVIVAGEESPPSRVVVPQMIPSKL